MTRHCTVTASRGRLTAYAGSPLAPMATARHLLVLLLGVGMLLGLSACATAREVREAVADGNAAALATSADSAIVTPKASVSNLEQSLKQFEQAIALPNVTPATVASLRMRQALLCLVANQRSTAEAYKDKVIPSDLRSRERKIFLAWGAILFDQELAQGGVPDEMRPTALANIDRLVELIGSDVDDVDHCLAHYAVATATRLAKSKVGWDQSQAPTRRAAAALYQRFGDERDQALAAIVAANAEYPTVRETLSAETATRVDAARRQFFGLRTAMADNEYLLSPGDGVPDALLRYLNRQ